MRSPVAVDVLSIVGLGSLSISRFSHLPCFGDRFGKTLFEEPLYPNRMASNAMNHPIRPPYLLLGWDQGSKLSVPLDISNCWCSSQPPDWSQALLFLWFCCLYIMLLCLCCFCFCCCCFSVSVSVFILSHPRCSWVLGHNVCHLYHPLGRVWDFVVY